MNKYIFNLLIILLLIGLLWCGKGDDIIGSRTDTIENMEVSSPFLLADGISTAIIVATVYDSAGKPASGLPVHFNTTAGTITEQVVSQSDGYAYAVLKSAASETDLKVTVTATVLDTTFGLPKANFGLHKVNLKIQGFKKYPDRIINLKKCSSTGDNSATVELTSRN